MKEDIDYQCVSDICIKGSSNIAQNKLIGNSGDYPIFGASGFIKNIDFYHQESEYIGIVKDGSGVGRVNKYPSQSSLLGTMQYILPKDGNLLDYVKYALQSLDLSHFATGVAIPHIYFRDYGKCKIPVPPLPEQQAIALELDAIQSLITKYKEQLNDYDNLAKSIFNEMFGDVVSNDKGWERGKIGDVCEFSQGVQVEVSNQSIVESSNKIRFLRIVDFTQANEQPRYIDIPNEKYIISKEDISMVRYGASVGYVCCGLSGAIANNLFKITPQKNILGNTFCTYFLKSDYFQGKICNNKKGCAMPAINFKTIKPIPIPLPPLPLQQTFAARITAIESQKDKLKQQITDLQTLFDSRMQYYFD